MNRNEQEYLVQRIRTQYTEKEHTELDALKALDQRVKKPAQCFAYGFGTLSALVMGSGMSLVMTDLGATLGLTNAFLPGLIVGIVGLAMAAITCPIYKRILSSRRKRFAPEIIALSNRIMAESEEA